MSAMDNATRNAGEAINKLTLNYNRTRQANITRELIEIISRRRFKARAPWTRQRAVALWTPFQGFKGRLVLWRGPGAAPLA